MCSGDWIFQIDADEVPHETFNRITTRNNIKQSR